VGLGRVDALADGAASGRLESEIRRRASGEEGMRIPTVAREEGVTSAAKGERMGSGKRRVRGPGQNRVISGWYIEGIGSVSFISRCEVLGVMISLGLMLREPFSLGSGGGRRRARSWSRDPT
jgi:hypothetical protein